MSHGTPAYTAELWVDGERTAHCQNDGAGGADVVQRCPPATWDTLRKVEQHCAAMPSIKRFGMVLKMSLELWCHEQVFNSQLSRKLKKKMKTHLLFVVDDKVCSVPIGAAARIKDRVVLNNLPFKEAEDIWINYCNSFNE
jgi:hypothetical protein